MKGWLTESQKQYILEHLGHHVTLSPELTEYFSFGSLPPKEESCIHFHTSQHSLDLDKVLWIDELPVLYPCSGRQSEFYSVHGKQLIFHHDLLKSAFHFLSGYEEFRNTSLDQYGRFPYKESLQYKLGIIGKPIVNYYFEVLIEGISEFARKNNIPFRRNPVLKQAVLMVSHDIDKINSYGFFETGFRLKQFLGLAGTTMSRKNHFIDLITSLFHFLNPFSRKDPFWSFESLMYWAEERGFRDTFYFLQKEGGRNENSRYHFHSKKFRELFRELSSRGHEVGIHGTLQSASSQEHMNSTVNKLREVSPAPVIGIRQHFLKFDPRITAQIQEEAGLKYDTSLGFAEHDGFRHSYCWPFRMFDFHNNCARKLWEIPLTVMESTHFYYRKLDLEGSRSSIEKLLSEVLKFNGVFCLLWHNNFFEEREIAGITDHYTGILDLCRENKMEGLTGRDIQKKMSFES